MIPTRMLGVAMALVTTTTATAQSSSGDTLRLAGLREPVEVLRDRWGIAHIYAKNEHDLFFAQGYVAAKDRTFQLELKLLGTKPRRWTPDVVISRHQGLLGNITEELATGRAVAALGTAKVKEINWYHPHDPKLDLDPAVNGALLSADILALYNAFRAPV